MKKTIAAACLAVLTTASAAPEAAPPPAYDVEVIYGVSLLGFSIGSLQVNLKLQDGKYQATAFVRPEGLAASLAPNMIDAVANGFGGVGVMKPNSSWIKQQSSKRTQIVTIQFQSDGVPAAVADPVYDVAPWTPKPEDAKGAVDPLGGVIAMMLLPNAGPGDKACGASIPVYDGRRLYAFDMWSNGETQVTRGGGGYKGAALHCVATYRRIAGWDAERMKKATSTKIELFAAPIGKGANGGPAFYLPVRMWADADIGDVVAAPRRVTINGKDWAQFFAEGG